MSIINKIENNKIENNKIEIYPINSSNILSNVYNISNLIDFYKYIKKNNKILTTNSYIRLFNSCWIELYNNIKYNLNLFIKINEYYIISNLKKNLNINIKETIKKKINSKLLKKISKMIKNDKKNINYINEINKIKFYM